jgi:hypothetical protein
MDPCVNSESLIVDTVLNESLMVNTVSILNLMAIAVNKVSCIGILREQHMIDVSIL